MQTATVDHGTQAECLKENFRPLAKKIHTEVGGTRQPGVSFLLGTTPAPLIKARDPSSISPQAEKPETLY